MRDRTSRTRAASAAAVLAASTLVASQAAAFGTPTYIIYVAGPSAGTYETSGGAPQWPEGACGFRITNADTLAWEWLAGEYVGTGPLDVPNNGWMPPDNELMWLLQFTGPFGACEGEGVHNFQTPANPEGPPPVGALALVVQFYDADDIEFLDGNSEPIEFQEPPDGPEPPEDICEIVPEFCELPDDFAPCMQLFDANTCDEASGFGSLALAAGDFLGPVSGRLTAVVADPSDGALLKSAAKRAKQGLAFLGPLDHARDRALRFALPHAHKLRTQRRLSSIAAATDMAAAMLKQCSARLEHAARVPAGGAHTLVARAAAMCHAAADNLSHAQAESGRLVSVDATAERH